MTPEQQARHDAEQARWQARREIEQAIAKNPQPGAIYHTSWGYDQTNVEFFEVVKRTPGTVTLRRLCATVEDGKLYPKPGAYCRDWGIDGNPGTSAYEKAAAVGYSEKVCRLATKPSKWDPTPRMGASLTIDDVRHAWPWSGGGKYDTHAAGHPGH